MPHHLPQPNSFKSELSNAGLCKRVASELVAASLAALAASPLVTVIDKSLVQEISQQKTFVVALKEAASKMLTQPKSFFFGTPFLFTLAVYQVTYSAANLSETFLDYKKVEDLETRKTVKVSLAATANISMLSWRDAAFAKRYASSTSSNNNNNSSIKRVPMKSLGLFATRDFATMYATFYIAPKTALYLQERFGVAKISSELGCALSVPAAMQVVTAPLHILSFDLYQRQDSSTTYRSRLQKVKEEMPKTCFGRCFRILPAFGLGSFTNTRLREFLIA